MTAEAVAAPRSTPGARQVRRADRAWLAGTFVVAGILTVLAGRWTQDMWGFVPDEVLFRGTAAWVPTDLPWSLFDLSTYERGVQRLGIWIQAAALELFGSPDGFRVARWAFGFAFASTVAPIWLLARAAGAGPAWASVGALLGVVVPWVEFSGTFLTEPIAYPLFAWAMLAFWACAVRGGWRLDVLALAAIAVASLARTSMLLLAGVLAIVVVGHELRLAPRRGGLRRLPAGLASRHPVLLAAGAAAALLALAGATRRLIGVYEGVTPHADRIADGLSFVVAVAAPGLAFVAVIAAVGFALTQVVRVDDEAQLALAWVVLGALALMVLIAATGNPEERYVFHWAAPCAAALAVAASRRGVAWWALLGGAGLVLWACHRRVWPTTDPDFTNLYFLPAEMWNSRVIRLGIGARLPGSLSPGAVQALVIAAAACLAAALTLRLPARLDARRGVRLAGLGAGVALVVAGAAQAAWVLDAYLDRGGGWRPVRQLAWIDRGAGDRTVGLWLPPAATGLDPAQWRAPRYYNLSVRQLVRLGASQEAPEFPADERPAALSLDSSTGRLRLRPGDRMPPLVVVLPERDSAPLRGTVVARGTDWGELLLRPAQPLSVRRAVVSGPEDGLLRGGEALVIRSYAPYGAARACLTLTFHGNDRAAQATVRAGGRTRRISVAPAGAAALTVPLAAGFHSDVAVRAAGAPTPGWVVSVNAAGPQACTRRAA